MWPFSRHPARPTAARSKHSSFRPRVEGLEERTLLSHTITLAVPVNAAVLSYAESHVGKIVGDGQCATLAQDAVQSAGGVPFNQLGPTGLNAAYVWGKHVATLTPGNGNTSAIAAGDILQFTNVTEVDTMTVHYTNGRTTTTVSTQTPTHHTAIVRSVGGTARNDLQVLQANVKLYSGEPQSWQYQVQGGTYFGGTSTVTLNYPQYGYSITVTHTMTSGTINVYQPYANVSITVPSVPTWHF